jgi:hypothetical protein
MDEIKALLLQVLITVRDAPKHTTGLCNHVEMALENTSTGLLKWALVEDLLVRMMLEWPEFSGSPTYPVPSSNHTPPEEAYWKARNKKWSKRSKYGKARWRLLHWLITELEKANV